MIFKISLKEKPKNTGLPCPLPMVGAILSQVVGMWNSGYVLDERSFAEGTKSAIATPLDERDWTLTWIDEHGDDQGPIMINVEVLEEFPHPSAAAVSP